MGLTRIYKFCLPNTKWIPNYFIAFSELFYRPLILHLSPCGNLCALLNSTYPSTKHNKYHMGTLQFPDSHFCTQVSGFQVSQFCHNSALVFKHSSWVEGWVCITSAKSFTFFNAAAACWSWGSTSKKHKLNGN